VRSEWVILTPQRPDFSSHQCQHVTSTSSEFTHVLKYHTGLGLKCGKPTVSNFTGSNDPGGS
jgi:hypothetical protein